MRARHARVSETLTAPGVSVMHEPGGHTWVPLNGLCALNVLCEWHICPVCCPARIPFCPSGRHFKGEVERNVLSATCFAAWRPAPSYVRCAALEYVVFSLCSQHRRLPLL